MSVRLWVDAGKQGTVRSDAWVVFRRTFGGACRGIGNIGCAAITEMWASTGCSLDLQRDVGGTYVRENEAPEGLFERKTGLAEDL